MFTDWGTLEDGDRPPVAAPQDCAARSHPALASPADSPLADPEARRTADVARRTRWLAAQEQLWELRRSGPSPGDTALMAGLVPPDELWQRQRRIAELEAELLVLEEELGGETPWEQ